MQGIKATTKAEKKVVSDNNKLNMKQILKTDRNAKELGMTYGQYQAMKYLESNKIIKKVL